MKFKRDERIVWINRNAEDIEKKPYIATFCQYIHTGNAAVIEIDNPLHARSVFTVDIYKLIDPNDVLREII